MTSHGKKTKKTNILKVYLCFCLYHSCRTILSIWTRRHREWSFWWWSFTSDLTSATVHIFWTGIQPSICKQIWFYLNGDQHGIHNELQIIWLLNDQNSSLLRELNAALWCWCLQRVLVSEARVISHRTYWLTEVRWQRVAHQQDHKKALPSGDAAWVFVSCGFDRWFL